VGSQSRIVIADPELLKQVMVKRFTTLPDRGFIVSECVCHAQISDRLDRLSLTCNFCTQHRVVQIFSLRSLDFKKA